MRLRFDSIMRVTVILVIFLHVLAVVLARSVPDPRSDGFVGTQPPEKRFAVLPGIMPADHNGFVQLIDLETGGREQLALPDGDILEYASFSPWRDQNGQAQIVGRWRRFEGDGADRIVKQSGLARLAYPGGEVIDRYEVDAVPTGKPCWLPDGSARVMYPSGDGGLYVHEFSSVPDRLSRRVTFDPAVFGGLAVHVQDVTWSEHPQLRDFFVMTLFRYEARTAGAGAPSAPPAMEMWWARLDTKHMNVSAAGRLLDFSGAKPPTPFHERLPEMTSSPNALPLLAFLVQGPKLPSMELRVGAITRDPVTKNPCLSWRDTHVAVDHCLTAHMVFAGNGLWVAAVTPVTPVTAVAPNAEIPLRQIPLAPNALALARRFRNYEPSAPAEAGRIPEKGSRFQPMVQSRD